jgi:hypothetical protein
MTNVNGWLQRHMGIVVGFAAVGVVSLAVVLSNPAVAVSPTIDSAKTPVHGQNAVAESAGRVGFERPWMGAKYVFFFIGDGMASVQIHAAEAYLEAENHDLPGAPKAELLTMSQFPVQGMATTFADNRFITGSAAAGTALACGVKTSIGNISMAPDETTPYTSVAELARDAGMKVGIVSSVSIDHATPAVFYAHQPSRSMYYEISQDLANSDFDYFGGGGFVNPEGGVPSTWDALTANGYTHHPRPAHLAGSRASRPAPRRDRDRQRPGSPAATPAPCTTSMDRAAVHGMSLAEFTERGHPPAGQR